MIRMVFFAPYPEILPIIRQVFSERPDQDQFQYEVIQDFFNNPLDNINADVAIARGFTAHTMQKKGIICTELKVTGYDVIAAIDVPSLRDRLHILTERRFAGLGSACGTCPLSDSTSCAK